MCNTESINLILGWPNLLSCETKGDFHPLRTINTAECVFWLVVVFFPSPDVCLATALYRISLDSSFGLLICLLFLFLLKFGLCQALCRQVHTLRIWFKWFNSTQLDSAESIKHQVKRKRGHLNDQYGIHRVKTYVHVIFQFLLFINLSKFLYFSVWTVLRYCREKNDFLGFWHEASLLEIVKRLRGGWMLSLANVFKKWGNLAGSHGFNILFMG